MRLADEPREFNLPTLPERRIAYVPEKLSNKYGVHSEEYLPIRTVMPVVAGIVALYGVETWTLRRSEEKRLEAFEMCSLFQGFWPLKKSLMLAGNEFQSLGRAIVKEDEYEEVRWDGIVSIASWRERVFRLWWEERRLEWVGHVYRMEGNRIPKKILEGKIHGKRPIGRPKNRWIDAVTIDSQDYLGTTAWRRLAQDRDSWRKKIEEAKARLWAVMPS
ncbi:hypothetical protein ANN_07969 [Periplaneta americana]|uniref:Uncharacterized protein n=1 Tax=Periplaneta americana TaxID=6978 RepID=A0ABQ8T041_PERAM|nr:hypothetical protein ANN_07969 [Periplaneta americana]